MAQVKTGESTEVPAQQQMSAAQIVQNMRDTISLIDERAKDQRKAIFDNIIQQLAKAAQTILEKDKEIQRLQQICKEHKIDFVPKPNRKERRKQEKIAKKAAKKVKK